MCRRRLSSFFALAAALLLATPLLAQQTGSIVARARDGSSNLPMRQVNVTVAGGPAPQSLQTNQSGLVVFEVAPGSYTVTFSLLGYEDATFSDIQVAAGESTTVSAALSRDPVVLGGFVISASRNRATPEIESPNTTSVITEVDVRGRISTSPTQHLETTVGADIMKQGVQSSAPVLRGFNNIFSGALHALTDNRIAGIPSLRVNLVHFIPSSDADIEQIEVVLGPGSALYGPNTANGVLHIITKSPLTEQGTTASVAGGEREFFKGMFRTAHKLSDDFGVKVSGQYLRGQDWLFVDPSEVQAREECDANPAACREVLVAQDPDATEAEIEERFARIGVRDRDFERLAGEVRADWRLDDASTLVFQAGLTSADGIELTGIGAGRTENWLYSYVQGKLIRDRLFAQLYLNKSDAGESFLVRQGAPLTDNSELLVGQLQHGFGVGDTPWSSTDNRQDFTYGIDLFLTTPKTDGDINGQYEEIDDIDEVGGYIQSTTQLTEQWEFLAAARVDKSSVLDDPVFSPRVGLLFKPTENHTLRATYNRAFSTPTTLNYFLDINGGRASGDAGRLGYFLRALGTGEEGFSFQTDGQLDGVRSPFTPAALGGPGQLLPADPEVLWPLLIGALQQVGEITAQEAAMLNQLPVAGLGLNLLDPATGSRTAASETVVPDTPPLEESITNTFEVGYQGILSDRFKVAADVFFTRRENFTSPLVPRTPLVLLDSAGLANRLIGGGSPPADAAELAGLLGGVPVAVVSSDDVVTQTADIVASYINFGELDYFGADFAIEAEINDQWRAKGAFSWIEDDFFIVDSETDEEVEDFDEDIDEVEDINEVVSLNAPNFKWSGELGYRIGRFGVTGRIRHSSEFGANSADFIGLDCLPLTQAIRNATDIRDCVDDYTVVDLGLRFDIPETGAELLLDISNVFDDEYEAFVGVPKIGRLALLQLRYTF